MKWGLRFRWAAYLAAVACALVMAAGATTPQDKTSQDRTSQDQDKDRPSQDKDRNKDKDKKTRAL